MGNCCATKISSDSPSRSASPSPSGARRRKGGSPLTSSSSRVSSSSSVPPTPRSEGEILQSANVRSFTFTELRTATRNFRPDSVLGEGGFGSVFKGWIDETTFAPTRPGTGMVIAVKKLNQEGFQGHREWLAEVNYLGQLSHPNLVKLVGYCLEDEQRLLVYEFMPRGSLENHLFRRGSHFQPLSWNLRMKVALGAAKGLAFLHSDKAKVIYRDFKTSNVLLDSSYNAKLSDFGLAKDGPTGDKSHVSTRVMGTYGYAAPEYLATVSARPEALGEAVKNTLFFSVEVIHIHSWVQTTSPICHGFRPNWTPSAHVLKQIKYSYHIVHSSSLREEHVIIHKKSCILQLDKHVCTRTNKSNGQYVSVILVACMSCLIPIYIYDVELGHHGGWSL